MTLRRLSMLLIFVTVAVAAGPSWAEEKNSETNSIDIGKMTCKQLMSGDDLDREVGIAFYHGYFAGKDDTRIVDLPKASAVSTAVKDYCLSNPTSTVMDAFAKAGK